MCYERKTNKSAHPHNHFPIRFFWRREIIEKHIITSDRTQKTYLRDVAAEVILRRWHVRDPSSSQSRFFWTTTTEFQAEKHTTAYVLSLSLRVFLLSRILLLSALFICRELYSKREEIFFPTFFFHSFSSDQKFFNEMFMVSNETLTFFFFQKKKNKKFKNKKRKKKKSFQKAAAALKRSR